MELDQIVLDLIGQNCIGLDWIKLYQIGIGLDRTIFEWILFDWIRIGLDQDWIGLGLDWIRIGLDQDWNGWFRIGLDFIRLGLVGLDQ